MVPFRPARIEVQNGRQSDPKSEPTHAPGNIAGTDVPVFADMSAHEFPVAPPPPSETWRAYAATGGEHTGAMETLNLLKDPLLRSKLIRKAISACIKVAHKNELLAVIRVIMSMENTVAPTHAPGTTELADASAQDLHGAPTSPPETWGAYTKNVGNTPAFRKCSVCRKTTPFKKSCRRPREIIASGIRDRLGRFRRGAQLRHQIKRYARSHQPHRVAAWASHISVIFMILVLKLHLVDFDAHYKQHCLYYRRIVLKWLVFHIASFFANKFDIARRITCTTHTRLA